jgi:hypothetical protein
MRLTQRFVAALAGALVLACAVGAAAQASFPYLPGGSGDPHDYTTFHAPQGTHPNDLDGHDNVWHWAASQETSTDGGTAAVNGDPRELNGVRGSHLVDASTSLHAGWEVTTGRPDVAIAVLDSGIEWNSPSDMSDLRMKVRLNKGELPMPEVGGPTRDGTAATNCSTFSAGFYDVNGDGVFNVADYACDPRVSVTDHHEGPAGVLTPQDVIVAFSKGAFHGDGDGNGFVDDIAGWDFLDNDNDPYDDVQYGHGTGEARDSNAEANNGNQAGSCPNCMVVPLRVGDSFVADVNRFAQATVYAVDNNVLVVQEALGTLNNSHLARRAVNYAWDHGVTIIASAADESAQHHNWPSTYDHTLVVNSVTKYPTQEVPPGSGMDQPLTPSRKSYLQFNGCTNFSTRVTLAIPSTSCSSDATGQAGGMAGLIYSAAINAHAANHLPARSDCHLTNGDPCLVTPNEVRQLMATGSVSSVDADPRANSPDTSGQADDVNFLSDPDTFGCFAPTPAPGCTDPNARFGAADTARPYLEAALHSYPARKGYDEFYGFGRVNMIKAVDATAAGLVPPEAEIDSPGWYEMVDPARTSLDVGGHVNARGADYTCTLEAAPGSEPNNADVPTGDFTPVSSGWCDGTTHHTASHDGSLGAINLADLKGRFPASTDFTGPAPTPQSNVAGGGTHLNNRPAQEPYGFTLRVVVTAHAGPVQLTGQDRQNEYLHRDADLLPGFPKTLPSDGASSPALADLNGDNKNEVVFGTSDGIVHAMRPDGSELPGWPVHVDPLPLHGGGRAFTSGDVPTDSSYGAILASPAVADIDHDGVPEVVVADFEGKVYVFGADGTLKHKMEADPSFSGEPLQPFENVRKGERYRTQHGFFASPVLADLDRSADGKLEIVAAGLDRHVYAWRADGSAVPGFPVEVIDRSKVSGFDPATQTPTFASATDSDVNQGAIVDTPAVGDIAGDPKPEIVVGTNEEYPSGNDGGLNAGSFDTTSFTALGLALKTSNTRLFAFPSSGEPGGPHAGSSPFLPGWPVKMAQLQPELLPLVGEGVTGSPTIAPVDCQTGGSGAKVGAISDAGPAYVWNPDGTSCYGQSNGHDNAMQTDFSGGAAQYDHPAVPAVGQPAFANLDGTGPSFISPAAGVLRSLDIVLPEYQGGQDFVAAWNAASGQYRPGFPTAVNDLQFLTGPSAADIDGLPGQEIVGGSATLDLNAFNSAGAPADPSRWPKFSGDWMVANPAIGSFGTEDTSASARKVIVAMTRAGNLFAYSTSAPACSEGDWPRFHHDNANSGDLRRDAVSPGAPTGAKVLGSALTFRAPGDDLLCGNVKSYELVTSDAPIRGSDFGSSATVTPAADKLAGPGANQTLDLPFALRRYVAVRAVDDQGNAGRLALVDRQPGSDSNNGGGGGNNGGGGGNNGGGNGSGSGCTDKLTPRSTISRRALHKSRRGISARGHSRDRGCAGLRRVDVSIAKLVGKKCRFLTRKGKLTRRRSCRKPLQLRARGLKGWSIHVNGRIAPGRYRLIVRAVDRKGHREGARRANTMRFRAR